MATRQAWTPNALTWQVAQPFDDAEDLARQLHTTGLVAQVLHNRGLDEIEIARAFMDPQLTALHDPTLLGGAEQAAKRIARAIENREKIVIYGDYDVDGITAVAILHACLAMLGAEADYYVPHRLNEGYGVNADAVRALCDEGAQLIVTVDCGISAVGPVADAADAGVEVIVTDHHTPGLELPAALAVVHPRLGGRYPNPDLCGAGVAFKLAWQIAREVRGESRVDEAMRTFLVEATALAAMGTIADVVPLVGENRVLAAFGLKGLSATRHPGLAALLASAGLAGQTIDAHHVGFRLGPRLNAAGRMGHAREAVELLANPTPRRAAEIAGSLDRQNARRQEVDRAIADEAAEMVVAAGMDSPETHAIVLGSETWHGGVIGIVASRLVERFARPVVLVSFTGGVGHGSGRSVDGVNLFEAIGACAEHLVGFGGHAMAAGVRIEQANLPAFAEVLNAYVGQHRSDTPGQAVLHVDAETTLAHLSYPAVAHLEKLAPFGQGNPPAAVAVRGCKLIGAPRRMGRNGQAVSLMLGQGGATARAVGFAMGDLPDALVGVNTVDVAGLPQLNAYQGRTTVQIQLRDVRWF